MKINDNIDDGKQRAELLQALKTTSAWQRACASSRPYSVIKTGFSDLDNVMALGGWPLETTTELAFSSSGIGELRLLLPALKKHLSTGGMSHLIWINPPYLPYAPALFKQNIDPARLLVVRPQGIKNILWAVEQALLSQSFAAVFTWTGAYRLNQKESRRLQLAVEKSSAWHVQFRHSDCLQQPSAARLRLNLASTNSGELSITVCKQPQGVSDQHCLVSVAPHYEHWRKISVNSLPQPEPLKNRALKNAKLSRLNSARLD